MKTKLIAAALLGATAIAGCGAIAQMAAPESETKAQYLAKAGARFDTLDANRDGRLTRDERRAGRAERREDRAERRGSRGPRGGGPGARAERMDLDNDGRVSRQEATQASADRINRMFERMDRNRDGFIDASERPQRGGPAVPPADAMSDDEE